MGFAYNGGRPVRIFIRADENAVINFNNSSIFLKATGVEGIYYYDIVHEGASTGNNVLSLSYPNFSSPGSKMQVWAVEFDDETVYNIEFKDTNKVVYPADTDGAGKYKVSEKYFEIEWTTKPNEFKLSKTYDSSDSPYFIKSSDGKVTLSDLKYRVTFTKENAEEADINIGSDIVRYVDYADTLTLPEKLKWREEISTNYTNTHFIKNGNNGTLYINIGGKDYELFSLTNAANLVDMSIKPIGGGKYSLCWRLANTSSTAEIPVFDGYITFGPEIIVADNDVTAGTVIRNIDNSISANEYFTFSKMQSDSGAAAVTAFEAPESKLVFSKEVLDTVNRMGEDVQYKITVENPSAFEYTGMSNITDDLNADNQAIHYIKPENMQALFDDPEYGDRLTITIKNAILAKPLTSKDVKAVNEDAVKISEQNTAAESDQKHSGLAEEDTSVAYRDVTITLSKNGDGNIELHYNAVTVDYTITIGAGKTIADALSEIGYIVTMSDSYRLDWDFSGYRFEGGKKMEFFINATIKDSLMYLPEKDHNAYYNAPSGINISAWNKAELNGTEKLSDETKEQIVHQDLTIKKGAYIGGDELNETYQPKDNDVLDYYVKVTHDGSGSYDVLPVVDHMTGKQAVIVEVKRNEGAEWITHAGKTTIDGVDYYVLNQDYTYKGVYTSEYYADSITVTKNDDGLDTLIKYYIENTPGKNFELDVTYKAIASQELAGNDNTQVKYKLENEAWLNDRPGHRIYDQIGASGSAVEIDKKILVGEMKDDPADEEVVEELPIKQSANQVTHRLMLHSIAVKTDDDGNITDIGSDLTVNGKDIFDMLPLTGSAFDWSKDNISKITYKAGEPGYKEVGGKFEKTATGKFTYDDVEFSGLSENDEWDIEKGTPSEIVKPKDPDDQQYIQWNEHFDVILPPDAAVYMYVTLTFPGLDKDEQWDKYLAEKGTDTLVNTFYVYNMPSQVTHTLVDPPVALLQKGVYETGSYVTENNASWLTDQYFIGPDRTHYSNTYVDSRLKNTVTYYVVLRNSGNTNLYLAPLYDILPPGFTYMALRTADGSDPTSSQHVGNKETYYSSKDQATDNHVGIIAKPADGYNDDFAEATGYT